MCLRKNAFAEVSCYQKLERFVQENVNAQRSEGNFEDGKCVVGQSGEMASKR
jgi:hypothetical protein